MNSKNTAIGIDIGGTKISIALGSSQGKILRQSVIPTQTGKKVSSCLESLSEEIKSHIDFSRSLKSKVVGIGIGAPGPVNGKLGVMPRSPHLSGWKDVPMKNILQKKFKLPVFMANDANAAAVGEAIFGAGRGVKNFVYMTVSTGIGGGIFIDGKLLEGVSFVGGEVGHMVIVPKGDICFCGHLGCLEAYASGSAMARYAKNEIENGRKSLISNLISKGDSFGANILGKAYREAKDALALESYERGAFYLGIGVANLINILNPAKVILGGGVFKSAPKIFWNRMLASCKVSAWPEAYQAVKIVPSQIIDQVGNLGALALVFHQKKD